VAADIQAKVLASLAHKRTRGIRLQTVDDIATMHAAVVKHIKAGLTVEAAGKAAAAARTRRFSLPASGSSWIRAYYLYKRALEQIGAPAAAVEAAMREHRIMLNRRSRPRKSAKK
jgi:hypothetical protein